jgi:pantetheine-phosphate adenylyltransferase
MAPDNRIAVCPGTYDPITLGHVDVITRGAAMFDTLIVGVVDASVRKSQPLFSGEERVGFIRDATGHLGNVKVELFKNLVVDFARDRGAKAIVKGLRAISDFEYELEMNQLNRKLAPEIESIYVFASPEYSFLSSTGVKEMATFGGDVRDLVPSPVADALRERAQRT